MTDKTEREYKNFREALNEIEHVADVINIDGDFSVRLREASQHLREAAKYIRTYINNLNKYYDDSNNGKR